MRSVHDLHIWTVTSGFGALAAHVVVAADCDRDLVRRRIELLLHERFGIDHTTLQMEEQAPTASSTSRTPRRRPESQARLQEYFPASRHISTWLASPAMAQDRLALAALLAAAAALVVLLAASVAPAQDLESKLDAKEAKLSKVRERSGVLTTTISRYGERIDRLTGEVASLRNQEAAVKVRLNAKQAELDRAVAELDVAKKRLVMMRAHLKRALVSLRDRLVAMYETGTPDVLSVIVGANGYDDLIDRTEYLNRIRGNGRSGRRPGARTARPGQAHRRPPAHGQGPDRGRSRRDRRRRAGAGKRPGRGPGAPVGAGRRARQPASPR